MSKRAGRLRRLVGLAGLIQSFRVNAALTSLGTGLELETIAAAVIGGVAPRGGVGSVIGAILGSLLIGLSTMAR